MWTTAEQLTFLQDFSLEYKQRQANSTTPHIWPKIFEQWFARWPPSNEQPMEDTKKKLKRWFNNHHRGADAGRGPAERYLDLTKKTSRKLAGYQVYLKRFYKPKLQSIIDEGYNTYLKGLPEGAKAEPRLAYTNRRAIELLAAETDDIKAEVERERLNQS
ncbi:hypothetical protein DENSPDRAFT_855647, partial [Dentipellis sp. KUC8613]